MSSARVAMDDELDRFKREVNLAELAAAHGYQIDRRKSSRASIVMRHPATGDKVVISRASSGQHWTYFSVGDARDCGTVVDFLRHRGCPTLGSVRQELRRWCGDTRSIVPASSFQETTAAPAKDRRAVAAAFAAAFVVDSDPYLSSRGIRPDTIRSPRFEGTFRRDRRGNVLFPHVDTEGLSGFESKNHGWTAFSTGGVKALWRSNLTPGDRRLVLTESAIDGLSYHQLSPDEITSYASTAGTLSRHQRSILAELFRGLPADATMVLAFDADAGGDRLARDVAEIAQGVRVVRQVPPHGKDWNECLQRSEREYIASLPPFRPRRSLGLG
jgi:hypothetical protein